MKQDFGSSGENTVEATWLHERSTEKLRNFIEHRHSMLPDDIDLLAIDALS